MSPSDRGSAMGGTGGLSPPPINTCPSGNLGTFHQDGAEMLDGPGYKYNISRWTQPYFKSLHYLYYTWH